MQQSWWDAEEGRAHHALVEWAQAVESSQSDIFERFVKLAFLYDPYDRLGRATGLDLPQVEAQVTENVVAANVDTVAAIIARNRPRARFMTDDGDWSAQRLARRLEWYAEGLVKLARVYEHTQEAFKDAAKFGTGLVKVYENGRNVRVERVLVDEILVDEAECRSTREPLQLVQRRSIDKARLAARFPEKRDEIEKAHETGSAVGRWWANYREIEANQVVVLEAWRLPIGDPDDDDYVPGRHVISIPGADLLDEEWHKPRFPFAVMRWSSRTTGWYGVGLAERIAGHQRALNKLNWQIDRQLDQHAVPTTYVRLADANIAVKTTSRAGTIVPYKAEKPETIIPQAIGGETFKRQADIKSGAYEESGVSRLAAASMKPAGLESAVALREYKDSTTERFAIQEQAYERLFLDVVLLMLDCAKDLGDSAPTILRKSRMGSKRIEWADVDMGEAEVQIEAASSIARTPAGRTQAVIEWAQAGVISQDEARRLLQHPDLERAMSLYTAALEDIERTIEELLDGEQLFPEPYQNLKVGQWRVQQAYLKAVGDGAPEEILEALRTWIVQAAHLLAPPEPMPAPMGGMPGPGGMPPGPDMMAGAPPMEAAPQAALAPEAMALAPQ